MARTRFSRDRSACLAARLWRQDGHFEAAGTAEHRRRRVRAHRLRGLFEPKLQPCPVLNPQIDERQSGELTHARVAAGVLQYEWQLRHLLQRANVHVNLARFGEAVAFDRALNVLVRCRRRAQRLPNCREREALKISAICLLRSIWILRFRFGYESRWPTTGLIAGVGRWLVS